MANVEPNTLRLSESTLGKAFKSKPHLEKYTSRLKALDKDNNGELSLQEVAECVEDLVSREKANRIFKRVAITGVVLLILTVAATVGLTYAVVRAAQPMKADNGIMMSSGGQPTISSSPYLLIEPTSTPAARNTTRALLSSSSSCPGSSMGTSSVADLTTTCAQVAAGNSAIVLNMPEPMCNTTSSTCGTMMSTITVQYQNCKVLLDPATNACMPGDSYIAPGVAQYIILSGYTSAGASYSMDLVYNCTSKEWQTAPTINQGTCDPVTSTPSFLTNVPIVAMPPPSAPPPSPAPDAVVSSPSAPSPSPAPDAASPSPAPDAVAPSPSAVPTQAQNTSSSSLQPVQMRERSWTTVASSSSGQRLVASTAGYLYTSDDYGSTWYARNTDQPRVYYSTTSSSDGKELAAVVWIGDMFLSHDYGVTWTQAAITDNNLRWTSIASTASGKKIIGTVAVTIPPSQDYLIPAQAYTSADFGDTWTFKNITQKFYKIASSADGSKLVGAVYYGLLYTSNDFGQTWDISYNKGAGWFGVASSADGSTLAAVAINDDGIYISTDSGNTWKQTSAPGKNWRAIAMSDDGRKLVAAAEGDQLYVSQDGGESWTATGPSGPAYVDVASSADGNRLVAVAGVGSLYTSDDGGATWSVRL